jgi:hypothetical protein
VKLRKFVASWPDAAATATARQTLDASSDQGRLAAQQLRMMRKRWEGTPAAGFFDAAITRLEQP